MIGTFSCPLLFFEEVDLRTAVMGILFSPKKAHPEYLVALPVTLPTLLG